MNSVLFYATVCNLGLAQEVILEIDVEDSNSTSEQSVQGWHDAHTWTNLGLHHTIVAVTATWNERILAMDTRGRIHRMDTGGTWKVVLGGMGELVQTNPEDLLLDLESSLEEQWDISDEEPSYDEETEEVIPAEILENE